MFIHNILTLSTPFPTLTPPPSYPHSRQRNSGALCVQKMLHQDSIMIQSRSQALSEGMDSASLLLSQIKQKRLICACHGSKTLSMDTHYQRGQHNVLLQNRSQILFIICFSEVKNAKARYLCDCGSFYPTCQSLPWFVSNTPLEMSSVAQKTHQHLSGWTKAAHQLTVLHSWIYCQVALSCSLPGHSTGNGFNSMITKKLSISNC